MSTECPNVGKFITNLKFDLSMENTMMDAILKGGNANDVATEWLKKNPDAVDAVAQRRHHLRRRRRRCRGEDRARKLSALACPTRHRKGQPAAAVFDFL